MTNSRGSELAELLELHLSPLNEIDDAIASSSAECNYEDYEEFKNSGIPEFFDQDLKGVLKELKKKTESFLVAGDKSDVRNIFEESNVAVMKFNVFIWYFLENGKRSDSVEDDVENGVLAACCYIAICALPGANCDLFQIGLYSKCLKIARNCCQTVRMGETFNSKKGGDKKKKSLKNLQEADEEDGANSEPLLGPPRICVDSAERFLHQLTTQFFGFLSGDSFSLDFQTLMTTMEMIEDVGRLDLDVRSANKALRANSVQEFRCLDKLTDKYCAFVHALIESKYRTRGEMVYGRLIRPRLALMPYPDESTKTSKISTERKRAGELTTSLVLARISRKPGAKEMKLVQTVVAMVYSQCPDLAEFRTNIAQAIHKILEALPYQYAYDFVQLMHILSKGRGAGVKSLTTELANILLADFDFGAPDPGPVADEVGEVEQEEEEEEDEESEKEEDSEGGSGDESDGERNKSSRKKIVKEKEKKKSRENVEMPRMDATSVLYNVIYLACIDKSAALRLHGSHSLLKIFESPAHRRAFQECIEKTNVRLDEKFADASSPDSTVSEAPTAPKKTGGKTDLLMEEQQIIEKFNKLKMLNKGEARVQNDVIYMLVRRLATDEKAPVKKSACALLKAYLGFCDEQTKFATVMSILQKMCRDRMVSVRKTSADAITDLMLIEDVRFKEDLSAKWLHSLITMLNDTDNDVTEHARKLIMKVLTPLLENTSDLTWTLLDTIESVTNHRQYLMSTLKDAVREKLVRRSVMDSMKAHIASGTDRVNGAWMVFSQLSVQYEANVDFAIDAFHSTDLSVDSNLVQYIVHVIENNVKKIEKETRKDLESSMRRTLLNFCLHSAHARSLYHCLGKIMDGIGDRAENGVEFRNFAEQLLVNCFDTVVQSFEMFKDQSVWKQNAASQERLLITALNVASEVFSFSPQLIPRHERLGKTLSLIVNSHDNDRDAETVNPDMPSAHHTRPNTQLSEMVPSSQKTTASGGIGGFDEGVMFGDTVRAVAVVTLANMILAHDRLLKLMPMFVKQLQNNPSHQIRSNIVVAIGDICASYKTDRYAPMLAASLCDPSVLVRRHAINQIARLISYGIFRFNGEIMIRMMLATLDANEDVRNDAKLYISEVLQAEEPNFFSINFVQYMIALTQARRLIGASTNHEDDRSQVDVAIGGGDPLAKPSRIAIYTFMIESLDDRARFDVKTSICQRIFTPVVNGEYDFGEYNVQCLLDDALLIMSSNEMQVKMDVGKDPSENAIEEPSAEVMDAAAGFLQKVYLENYMKTIVPSVLALREFLNQHRSPLQRKCLSAIRMICLEHKNDMDKILADNRQLKDEMTFELQRVKQRTEEANRILDEYLRKVSEFQRQQKRVSLEAPAVESVEMTSPVRDQEAGDQQGTPEQALKTPVKNEADVQATPQSRLLSPKTIKKIRRSVGALLRNNDMRLNAPVLEDTHLNESIEKAGPSSKEKTIVEEPVEAAMEENEEEGAVAEEVAEQNEPEAVEQEKQAEEEPVKEQPGEQEDEAPAERSRRRKTPTYNENESVDSDGRVWKKPKVSSDQEKLADISMNVTLRRTSRRNSRKPEEVVQQEEEKKQKKRPRGVEEPDEKRDTRGMTPVFFDESKLSAGRQCSTPISSRDEDGESGEMTFALNLSAITEREELKGRKSQAHYLQNIFEDDEEEE